MGKGEKARKGDSSRGMDPFPKKTSFDYLFSIYWFSIIPEEVLSFLESWPLIFMMGPFRNMQGCM